jgi:hypothetical protein
MAAANGWKPTLRYSPVNGIIVDWGIGSQPFAMCGMPTAQCEAPPPTPQPESCCDPVDSIEAVDTCDWFRWVPEVGVGVPDIAEEMVASYARRAGILFAEKSWVLRRQVTLRLQPGVHRYPLTPFEGERVVGVISIDSKQGACDCDNRHGGVFIGHVRVDQARQELVVQPAVGACGCHVGTSGPEWLLVTVWARPTEDSCEHDAFLYERYRHEITKGARSMLITEVHAYGSYKTNRGYANGRGDAYTFGRADRMMQDFERDARKARVEVTLGNAVSTPQPAPIFAIQRGGFHRR